MPLIKSKVNPVKHQKEACEKLSNSEGVNLLAILKPIIMRLMGNSRIKTSINSSMRKANKRLSGRAYRGFCFVRYSVSCDLVVVSAELAGSLVMMKRPNSLSIGAVPDFFRGL